MRHSERYIVFGGPLGNLGALEGLKALTEGVGPNHIICTGDVAGYFARPRECYELIKKWGIPVVAGNVEEQLAADADDCGCGFTVGSTCDILSDAWYSHTKSEISEENLAYIKTLPGVCRFEIAGKKVAAIHGGYPETNQFIFPSTDWTVKKEIIDRLGVDIVLAGHSGIAFTEVRDGKVWCNAGAIGLPTNDGTSRVWYTEISAELDRILFETKSFQYDYGPDQIAMRAAGLPDGYTEALETGLWPSAEILPEEEKRQTGKVRAEESLQIDT